MVILENSMGREGVNVPLEALQSNQAYEAFLHNAALAPNCVEIDHICSLSEEALPHLEDDSFDIIYIDGCHLHNEVFNDIIAGKRIISDGGIICGDAFGTCVANSISSAKSGSGSLT